MSVTITKADGTEEYFKVEKLRRSLRRAGAEPAQVNEIVGYIEGILYDGMHTQEIYRRAFDRLREDEPPAAARSYCQVPTGFNEAARGPCAAAK